MVKPRLLQFSVLPILQLFHWEEENRDDFVLVRSTSDVVCVFM